MVGQTYIVPVVLYRHIINSSGAPAADPELRKLGYRDIVYKYEFFKIPVLDNRPHTDPPSFPMHYHIDLRFYETTDLGRGIVTQDTVVDLTHEPMVCIREMPEYNYVALPLATMLETLYGDKKLSSCNRCPHKNQYVGNCSTRDNIIECPAHGLMFDATTRKATNRRRTPIETKNA